MASRGQYAEWLVAIIEGNDYLIDEIYEALLDDGYTDTEGNFIGDVDDE